MLFIIILCIALVLFVCSADLSWSNLLGAHRNNLVFEGRLQSYGAYRLRKEHPVHLIIAFALSTGLMTGGLLAVQKLSASVSTIAPETEGVPVVFLPPVDNVTPPKAKETPPSQTRGRTTSQRSVVSQQGLSTPEVTPNPGPSSGAIPTGGGIPDGGEITDPLVQELGGGGSSSAEPPKIEPWSEVMPEFPGGTEAMYIFLQGQITVPEAVKTLGASVKIYASFVVSESGEITEIKIVRGSRDNNEINEEVLDALRAMPRWKPGSTRGKNVAVRMAIPFSIEIR